MHLTGLNLRASISARLRTKIRKSGFTSKGYKVWTEDEDRILRDLYPDYDRIVATLTHRTRCAVVCRCQRLGVSVPHHHWRTSEINQLRRLYRTASKEEIMAALPGLPWRAICVQANKHGLRREGRLRHLRTGKPIMDSILDRIEELRWTLSDLDEACGTRTYFRHQDWRKCRLNMKRIDLAVKALGGDLVVKWRDYD